MLTVDMQDQAVLITGGTKGIGLAGALEFARAGARVYLTYKWGSADPEQVVAAFDRTNGPRPRLIQADVSVDEDTDRLLAEISRHEKKIDVLVSNVTMVLRTLSLEDYRKRSFFKSLDYSAWPLVEYTRRIKKVFGRYPLRIIGVSSDGPDHFYPGYDFVAASKAVLELFAKYLSVRLFPEGSRVNILRFGVVRTGSFISIFGEEFFDYAQAEGVAESVVTLEECGNAIVALGSGLLDAMNGQIVTVDHGFPLRDNTLMRYALSLRESAEKSRGESR